VLCCLTGDLGGKISLASTITVPRLDDLPGDLVGEIGLAEITGTSGISAYLTVLVDLDAHHPVEGLCS
jgi:hypothetical protein